MLICTLGCLAVSVFQFQLLLFADKISAKRLTIIYIIIYIIVILNRLIFCKYASCSLTKLKLKLLKFFFREVIFLAQFFFVSFFMPVYSHVERLCRLLSNLIQEHQLIRKTKAAGSRPTACFKLERLRSLM